MKRFLTRARSSREAGPGASERGRSRDFDADRDIRGGKVAGRRQAGRDAQSARQADRRKTMGARHSRGWASHGLIRPTVGCVVLIVFGGLCCYGGLLLDDRTLMLAAVMAAVLTVLDLILAAAQYLALRGIPSLSFRAAAAPGSSALRTKTKPVSLLLRTKTKPVPLSFRAKAKPKSRNLSPATLLAPPLAQSDQWEQLDQHGKVIARTIGEPRTPRGLFRRVSRVQRWRSPFALFAVRRVIADDGEMLLLPDAPGSVAAPDALDQRLAGSTHAENAGGVRAYVPGDPLKLISWRHTARHGELMTRETSRDAKPLMLLVFDASENVTVAQLDDAVAAAVPYLRASEAAGAQLVATDGRVLREGTGDVRRFLASMRPTNDTCVVKNSHASQADDMRSSEPTCAEIAEKIAAKHHGPISVIAFKTNDSNVFADFGSLGDTVHIVECGAHGLSAAHVSSGNRTSSPGGAHIVTRVIMRIAAMAGFFATAMVGLSGLIEMGSGLVWPWFLGGALAALAVEGAVPWRTFRHGVARAAIFTSVLALATCELLIVRMHALNGLWPWSRGGIESVEGAAEQVATWPWFGKVGERLEIGLNALIAQLPPLKVGDGGDLCLVIIAALAVALLRCLMLLPAATPWLVALPVCLLAADYALTGHAVSWWALAVLAIAFPLSLWARRMPTLPKLPKNERHSRSAVFARGTYSSKPTRPALAVPAAILAAAISLAATPAATDFAYRVPLSFGGGGGLFSTNTVNPLIDLKRNLRAGSSQTVLTYHARQRMYLRMASLGNFDGDTWRFDDDLARAGGFYGAGIQLGAPDENEQIHALRSFSSPAELYSYVCTHTGNGGEEQSDGYIYTIMPEDEADLYSDDPTSITSALTKTVRVDIDTLDSRFLPVPSDSAYVIGEDAWQRFSDGTYYNRNNGTSPNTGYSASGIAFEPISSTGGFDQVKAVRGIYDRMLAEVRRESLFDKQRRKVRQALADNGVGRVSDDWLLIDLRYDFDTNAFSWNDQVVGFGYSSRFEPTEEFRQALAFSKEEPYGLASKEDWGIWAGDVNESDQIDMLLALTMDGSESDADIDALSRAVGDDWPVLGLISSSGYDETDPQTLLPRVADMDEAAHRNYLTLPDELPANVRAVVRQAQEAVASGESGGNEGGEDGDGDYANQVARMRWLVDYFTDPANDFKYSLDAPDGDGRDNLSVLDDFLDPETGHSGYCQHYASALAVLGRALGVPTRVVLGYNRGVAPPVAYGEYEVAAKQLHAWVEAYLDGVGWVPFDVTPVSEDNGSAVESDVRGKSTQDEDDSVDANTEDPSEDNPDSQDDGQSDVADADVDGTATDNTLDDGEEREQTDGKPAESSGATSPLAWSNWPVWLKAAIVAVALALAAASPLLWRAWRRRWLRTVLRRAVAHPEDLALRSRAWLLLWHALGGREARRLARREPGLTDIQIAERLAQTSSEEEGQRLLRAARNASAVAFGGVPEVVEESVVGDVG